MRLCGMTQSGNSAALGPLCNVVQSLFPGEQGISLLIDVFVAVIVRGLDTTDAMAQ